ncbi:MAG: hypothetical protein MK052_12285 [Alphaproteobacteria bacterium]|nr:hypothetical protein [Alphaproteobacteria bacterium]
MKKFLTVFFLSTLLSGAAFANHHEGGHADADVMVEGDVMVEDAHTIHTDTDADVDAHTHGETDHEDHGDDHHGDGHHDEVTE